MEGQTRRFVLNAAGEFRLSFVRVKGCRHVYHVNDKVLADVLSSDGTIIGDVDLVPEKMISFVLKESEVYHLVMDAKKSSATIEDWFGLTRCHSRNWRIISKFSASKGLEMARGGPS